jgi:hypothetical protein
MQGDCDVGSLFSNNNYFTMIISNLCKTQAAKRWPREFCVLRAPFSLVTKEPIVLNENTEGNHNISACP